MTTEGRRWGKKLISLFRVLTPQLKYIYLNHNRYIFYTFRGIALAQRNHGNAPMILVNIVN